MTQDEYIHDQIDKRIHDFITQYPYHLVPIEIAMLPISGGIAVDPSMMHRIRMFNSRVFDRLTGEGYKLNMVEGRYEKPSIS